MMMHFSRWLSAHLQGFFSLCFFATSARGPRLPQKIADKKEEKNTKRRRKKKTRREEEKEQAAEQSASPIPKFGHPANNGSE